MNEKKKVLLVIDMQNDFVDGALGTPEAAAIVPAVCEKIKAAQREGAILLATMDTHAADYMETREGRFLPVPHCIKGTAGWQLRSEIAELLKDAVIIEKPSFGFPGLPEVMRSALSVRGIPAEEAVFEFIGVCTDICVVSNALLLKAAFPENDFFVDASCCAGVTPEKHEAALDVLRSCQIEVIGA